MRSISILVFGLGLVLSSGCGNKVKQTKEDAEVGAAWAEVNIRKAQALGVKASVVVSYSGASSGQVLGPGFQLNTGVTGTATFQIDPEQAMDPTHVGPVATTPIGNSGQKPPADTGTVEVLTPVGAK